MRKLKKTHGILFPCTVIGAACGLIVTKRQHAVVYLIIGPILGLIAGLILDELHHSKNRNEPED